MESKGITLETLFRVSYKLPQHTDIFTLIQEAIMVASWEKSEEFIKRRSSIVKSLYENPKTWDFDHHVVDDEASKKIDDQKKQKSIGSDESCKIKRRKLMESSTKKTLDHDLQHNMQTKLEESVKKVESRYQQIRGNKRKEQVLDMKDLPPPKSTCNEVLRQRRFKKQPFIRRQVHA